MEKNIYKVVNKEACLHRLRSLYYQQDLRTFESFVNQVLEIEYGEGSKIITDNKIMINFKIKDVDLSETRVRFKEDISRIKNSIECLYGKLSFKDGEEITIDQSEYDLIYGGNNGV